MLMTYVFTPDSVFKSVPPKAQKLFENVNESVFAWKPAFLQDSCQSFCGPGQLTWCQGYLKMHVVGEGPGTIIFIFETFPFSN